MTFRSATPSDLSMVISWIKNADECLTWAGPAVTFPIQPAVLRSQIEYSPDNSYCLLDKERLVAFGQLIEKGEQRLHLARIIVAPDARGNGYGRNLCQCLIARADYLKSEVLTLNVYQNNISALKLYRTVGFEPVTEPDDSLPAEVVHMRYPPSEETKSQTRRPHERQT